MNFLSFVTINNAKRKAEILEKYFVGKKRVLDFGCGDLSLSRELIAKNSKLKITGVDVVRLSKDGIPEKLKYIRYDGEKLPFKDKTFDLVLCFYVLHHCDDPEISLRECARVAKENVIIIESVPRNTIEIPIMGFVDWIFNAWKILQVPVTFKFYSRERWKKLFKRYDLRLISEESVRIVSQPSCLPLGKSYLFLCQTKHSV